VSTHGAWHGVAAEQGLVGLGLLGVLAVVLARRLARAPRDATWTAVVGVLLVMLAASIDLDVHRQRILWIAIGVAAGITSRRDRSRA
jgi:hypothetical protein